MAPNYIAGLDIGTTKICTVIAHAGDSGEILNIAGVGTVPARGMSKGVVVDIKQASESIERSVQAANHMAGLTINKALVGVTGGHIEAVNLKGAVSIGADEKGVSCNITQHDIARVFESAIINVAPNREILHLVPRRFAVDGQRGIVAPLDMNAARLEAEIHLVTAAENSLKNMQECTAKAGIEAQALVLEPIATCEAVSTPDERKLGVAMIDIGGGTSDIAVFCEGALQTCAIVPVGGNHVTRDISIGLRTPFEIAERLKIESGAVAASRQGGEETLEVLAAGGNERVRLPRAMLGKIIAPRMTELFEMARDAMQCDDFRRQLPAGIILTGGGSLLPGAVELAQQIFGVPVHLGKPSGIVGWADRVDSPKFATAVGLLHYARHLQQDGYAFAELRDGKGVSRRIWGVPFDFDNAAPAQDPKSISNDSVQEANHQPAPKTENASSTDSQNRWSRIKAALQPSLERLRQWLGFDAE